MLASSCKLVAVSSRRRQPPCGYCLQQTDAIVKMATRQAAGNSEMSLHALRKRIRDVNRRPNCRDAHFRSPPNFTDGYELSDRKLEALLALDMATGHGLVGFARALAP
jgi:hypothetical protein